MILPFVQTLLRRRWRWKFQRIFFHKRWWWCKPLCTLFLCLLIFNKNHHFILKENEFLTRSMENETALSVFDQYLGKQEMGTLNLFLDLELFSYVHWILWYFLSSGNRVDKGDTNCMWKSFYYLYSQTIWNKVNISLW